MAEPLAVEAPPAPAPSPETIVEVEVEPDQDVKVQLAPASPSEILAELGIELEPAQKIPPDPKKRPELGA